MFIDAGYDEIMAAASHPAGQGRADPGLVDRDFRHHYGEKMAGDIIHSSAPGQACIR